MTTQDGDKPTPETAPTEPPKSDDGNAKPQPETRQFTQAELDALFSERAKRAEEKARADTLAALGVEDVEAAKKLLADAEKQRKAQMTEAEKLAAERDEALAKVQQAQAESQAAIDAANLRLMMAAVQLEASKADYKFRQEALSDVWAFVDKSKLTVNEQGEIEGTAEAVKAVAEAKPYMVETDPGAPGTPARRRLPQYQPNVKTPDPVTSPSVKF